MSIPVATTSEGLNATRKASEQEMHGEVRFTEERDTGIELLGIYEGRNECAATSSAPRKTLNPSPISNRQTIFASAGGASSSKGTIQATSKTPTMSLGSLDKSQSSNKSQSSPQIPYKRKRDSNGSLSASSGDLESIPVAPGVSIRARVLRRKATQSAGASSTSLLKTALLKEGHVRRDRAQAVMSLESNPGPDHDETKKGKRRRTRTDSESGSQMGAVEGETGVASLRENLETLRLMDNSMPLDLASDPQPHASFKFGSPGRN